MNVTVIYLLSTFIPPGGGPACCTRPCTDEGIMRTLYICWATRY